MGLTTSQLNQIYVLYGRGMSIRAVAKKTGHAVATVHKYVTLFDYEKPGETDIRLRTRYIRELRERGHSIRVIADKVGVSKSTVHRAFERRSQS